MNLSVIVTEKKNLSVIVTEKKKSIGNCNREKKKSIGNVTEKKKVIDKFIIVSLIM